MENSNRQVLGFIGVIVFIGAVAILVLTQIQNTEQSSQVPVEERTTAHQLAIFAASQYVPEDHSSVEKFETLLISLASNTTSGREEIGNISTDSVIELNKKYDKKVELLDFMRRANQLAASSDSPANYQEIAAKVVLVLGEEKAGA